ncbi:hypothetical protein D9756_000762 [Leucocoprinus leucothites]|uniref:Bola-like protein n=1 Tax=Leucocoprinus leucothites TaxID=201217 RepID=A0A8H5GEZ7_9AGAR|nr:hypothetical protein D9756_000762 [Leucoagaricus leucothites]
MLQLRLAFQRCAGLDRLPAARNARLAALPFSSSAARWYSTPTPPPDLSEGEREIYLKLTDKFSPTTLRVQDISGGCGSFYAIIIASETFRGLSMVKQHQLVNKALKSEIESIHGLQLKTTVPDASATE